MKLKSYISLFLFLGVLSAHAQEPTTEEKKEKKAWEVGVGGMVFQFSRIGFSNFSTVESGYAFDLDLNHAVWGAGIYAARELNKYFYLDLQGNLGFTNKSIEGKRKLMTMAGLGLQWRLGEYFKSRYVDPYLRAGVNYMYKDFRVLYDGSEGLAPDEMSWILSNFGNKEGRDKKHLALQKCSEFLARFGTCHLALRRQEQEACARNAIYRETDRQSGGKSCGKSGGETGRDNYY